MNGLTRRQFGLAAAATSVGGGAANAQPDMPMVELLDGSRVPALGQGSAGLAAGRHPASQEEEALRAGISLGMTLLDTAEIYGSGKSEQMIGRVVAGQRDKVFVVSKVWPSHATPEGIRSACKASLARLATNYLDLYLLHWRTGVQDLGVVVQTFESLRAEGYIRRWGCLEFRRRGYGGTASNPRRRRLCHQPGRLQSRGSPYRTRPARLERAACVADHGLFSLG